MLNIFRNTHFSVYHSVGVTTCCCQQLIYRNVQREARKSVQLTCQFMTLKHLAAKLVCFFRHQEKATGIKDPAPELLVAHPAETRHGMDVPLPEEAAGDHPLSTQHQLGDVRENSSSGVALFVTPLHVQSAPRKSGRCQNYAGPATCIWTPLPGTRQTRCPVWYRKIHHRRRRTCRR